MIWRKIQMKFSGMCVVCNEKIEINEMGLWAKGLGVKHEKCVEIKELKCIICGGTAGCSQCEFQDMCDIKKISQLCICRKCDERKDIFESYLSSVSTKFPSLNLNSQSSHV